LTFDCWSAVGVQEYAITHFGIKGNTQNKLGETPLNKFRTESNDTNYEREAAFNLISKHNCDPIHITNEGNSFLGSVAANFQAMFNAMIEQNLINVVTARVEKNKNVFHYIFKKMYQKLVPLAGKQEYWPLLIEPDTDGETPLMLMLKSRDANENFVAHQEEMIDHFMYEHVSPSDPVTPIMYMARNHCTSDNHYLFDYLLQNMEKNLLDKDTPKHNSQTILHQLASHAPQKLIENFITTLQKTESEEDMAQYLNEKTADGKTAIVLLAEQGELAAIEFLMEQGATLSACEPINIVQVLSENNQHTQLLHVICDEKFKQVPVTLDLFVSAMKRFAIANASKQEQAVLNGFKQTLAAHPTEKIRFFELLVRVPSEIDMENENYGESCSVIQLFCNIKKRQIVEWIFETFKDLLEAKDSPFDKHPLDMICEQEKQGENNILHFLCSNANLKTLFKEPIKIPAPNMTAAKAIHSILVNYGRAAELYTQFNKQGETPIHVACRSGFHTVWNDMIANGAQFDVETKNGDAPGDLVTGEKAVAAFQKSMNKFNKLKAPAKKTKAKETKRKRDDDDEEEEERPVKRKVTRKSCK
jgi:ankyrin repeat protein